MRTDATNVGILTDIMEVWMHLPDDDDAKTVLLAAHDDIRQRTQRITELEGSLAAHHPPELRTKSMEITCEDCGEPIEVIVLPENSVFIEPLIDDATLSSTEAE